MDTKNTLLSVIDEVLGLDGQALAFDLNTPLLGAIPELDSLGVVTLIKALEERFGFVVDAEELSGAAFETVGTLVEFVDGKRQALDA